MMKSRVAKKSMVQRRCTLGDVIPKTKHQGLHMSEENVISVPPQQSGKGIPGNMNMLWSC